MADNLDIRDGSGNTKTVATTETGEVHTPHHRDPEAIAALGTLAGHVDGLETLGGLTNTALASILAKLSADPATQTTLAAVLAKLSADPATQTTSAAILAKLIAAPATEAKQDTLIAKDFATQTTLAAVLAKIIAAPATEAKQDALATLSGAVTETAPATDTASSGLNGRLQRIAQRITSLIALLPSALGQGTKSQGLRVVLPSDQDPIAMAAGEAHIGQVGGHTVYIDVTLTLDTSAYASGDVLADTQVVTNAMRANDLGGILQSVTVIDQDDQKAAFDIYFLSANVSMGTENSAPSISDANALEILGAPIQIAVSDYKDLGGVSIAGKDAIGKIVKPATGTRNLYVAVVNGTGAPTYTASGVKLRLGFLQD